MQKIAGDGATIDNQFQAGNTGTGAVATEFTAPWANAVQGEIVAVVEGAGLTLNSADNTQMLQAIRELNSQGGRRNVLINGAFQLNQRYVGSNATFTNATPGYTLDRWRFDPGTGNTRTYTVSRGGTANGSDVLGTRTDYSLTVGRTLAGNGSTPPTIMQRLEGVRTLAGKRVTLSVWLSQASGGTPVSVTPKLVQFKGTLEGVHSTQVGAAVTPATSGPVRYQWTFNLPAIPSTTIEEGNNYLELRFELSLAGDRNVTFRGAQLEVGASASQFEDLPLQDVQLLASRFYEKSYPIEVVPGTAGLPGAAMAATNLTAAYGLQTRFRVEKRVNPAVVWYGTLTGAINTITRGGAAGVELAVTAQEANRSSTGYPGHVTQGSTYNESWGHWTADAEL